MRKYDNGNYTTVPVSIIVREHTVRVHKIQRPIHVGHPLSLKFGVHTRTHTEIHITEPTPNMEVPANTVSTHRTYACMP